jgi:hypothetical protein
VSRDEDTFYHHCFSRPVPDCPAAPAALSKEKKMNPTAKDEVVVVYYESMKRKLI